MSSKSGLGFVIENYPSIVRAGMQLVSEMPILPEVRVDPDGERKADEKRRRAEEWRRRCPDSEAFPEHLIRKMPPLKSIYLQWLDTSTEPVWRDTSIRIDLESRRVHDADGLLGGGRSGSGAIGVFIFSSPVLLLTSPYLYARSRLWQARERRQGMSRHAIVLLERLKGQLDDATERLLREALRNDWTHHRKMTRRVTFVEARDLLTECGMTFARYGDPGTFPRGETRSWRDADGDLVASCELGDEDPNPPEIRVLGSVFRGDDADLLKDVCLHRNEASESPEG